jgi:L-threonylcarbamoyladenylate synthase
VTVIASIDSQSILKATNLLKEGRLVAMPTETVYGLGADATNSRAVAAIYAAKGRPSFNPLIAHVSDLTQALKEAEFSETALKLAEKFWPGPLTIVAPISFQCSVCDLARAGLDSVALRMPTDLTAQRLIKALGRPIAAPSANRSGHISSVTAEHVASDLLGKIDLILDGGPTKLGLESTIISFCQATPIILRSGIIAREEIEEFLNQRLTSLVKDKVIAPGMTLSHYAPLAALRLNAKDIAEDEAAIDFGAQFNQFRKTNLWMRDLSATQNLIEAASNLFTFLREADKSGTKKIAVASIPRHGLGEAINDRLMRASMPNNIA